MVSSPEKLKTKSKCKVVKNQADVSYSFQLCLCICLMFCVLSVVSGNDLQLEYVAEVKRLTPNSSVVLPCQVTGPYDP